MVTQVKRMANVRLWCALFSAALLAALMPAIALAAQDGDAGSGATALQAQSLQVGAQSTAKVPDGVTIFIGGEYLFGDDEQGAVFDASLAPKGVSYDAATNTLTLKDATLDAGNGDAAIKYEGYKDLTIKLEGKNKVTLASPAKSAIRVNTPDDAKLHTITITGNGSLDVQGKNGEGAVYWGGYALGEASSRSGIPADESEKIIRRADLLIEGVTITSNTSGINSRYGNVTARNATLRFLGDDACSYDFYGISTCNYSGLGQGVAYGGHDVTLDNSTVEIASSADPVLGERFAFLWKSLTLKGENAYVGTGSLEAKYMVDLAKFGVYDEDALHYVIDSSYLLITPKDLSLPAYPTMKPVVTLDKKSFKYTGKVQVPEVASVSVDGKQLAEGDYDVEWLAGAGSAKKVGTYKVKVTLRGDYRGSATASFKIVKRANPMVAKAKAKVLAVKYSKVSKKAQAIKKGAAFSVAKAKGTVTFKKVKGTKKIAVSKAGKVTVKKGLAKGTYAVKVKVTAAGGATYKAKSKTVTLKVRVK